MKDKVEFLHYSDARLWPPRVLKATTWEEVADELYNEGFANCGKRKVVKRTYMWICDEPQIIDTDYTND